LPFGTWLCVWSAAYAAPLAKLSANAPTNNSLRIIIVFSSRVRDVAPCPRVNVTGADAFGWYKRIAQDISQARMSNFRTRPARRFVLVRAATLTFPQVAYGGLSGLSPRRSTAALRWRSGGTPADMSRFLFLQIRHRSPHLPAIARMIQLAPAAMPPTRPGPPARRVAGCLSGMIDRPVDGLTGRPSGAWRQMPSPPPSMTAYCTIAGTCCQPLPS
jgi:hypothetical protein